MEKRIKTESLIEATVRVSNADVTDRRYDIAADVRISGTTVTSVSNGVLRAVGEADDYMNDATTFNDYDGGRMSVEFPSNASIEKKTEQLQEIDGFIAECRTGAPISIVE